MAIFRKFCNSFDVVTIELCNSFLYSLIKIIGWFSVAFCAVLEDEVVGKNLRQLCHTCIDEMPVSMTSGRMYKGTCILRNGCVIQKNNDILVRKRWKGKCAIFLWVRKLFAWRTVQLSINVIFVNRMIWIFLFWHKKCENLKQAKLFTSFVKKVYHC